MFSRHSKHKQSEYCALIICFSVIVNFTFEQAQRRILLLRHSNVFPHRGHCFIVVSFFNSIFVLNISFQRYYKSLEAKNIVITPFG